MMLGAAPPGAAQDRALVDRFFLVTCDTTVKAGWGDAYAQFVQELKTLRALELTALGAALRRAFDLTNQYRLQWGIDSYGQGRCPWCIDPATLVLITDGSCMTSVEGVVDQITIPKSTTAGTELTAEPFRWDQRMFGIVLKFPGTTAQPSNFHDPAIGPMVDVTGGKCHVVSNMKGLTAALDSIAAKMHPGVVVSFEQVTFGQPPPVNFLSCKRMLFTRMAPGFWPMPENFFPDSATTSFPPRSAHPNILVYTQDANPFIPENFPFDKYEVEPCQLTAALLNHKRGVCWQTFMNNSGRAPGLGEPFGFVKASSKHAIVFMYVLPYSYLRLFGLLDELVNTHKMSPTPQWRQQFENYIMSIPPYYIPHMKNALKRFGAPTVVPDHLDGTLNYSLSSYLKSLKHKSKVETDRAQSLRKQAKEGSMPALAAALPIKTATHAAAAAAAAAAAVAAVSVAQPPTYHQLLTKGKENSHDRVMMQDSSDTTSNFRSDFDSDDPLRTGAGSAVESVQVLRNAFDISRSDLLGAIVRLREQLFAANGPSTDGTLFSPSYFGPNPLRSTDAKHHVPISQMGDFQEFLQRQQVLRPVDEERERRNRRPLFGNPFRIVDRDRVPLHFLQHTKISPHSKSWTRPTSTAA
eukprot:TRINITY_DN4177_c0_g2_i2.p1 TRINITY_DN4177_c0_g2~~TRINITY_DN4177_c0_g2_i2.p1  ORF type:complete len:703 (-),score=137.21 TRINITY_DN4177_c0_g2_i2:641-2548(-)